MGCDDIFKKRRAELQERKKELRETKVNSFLIVSEGEKTEPNYFDGLAKYITDRYGSGIDVEKPTIDTVGEGKCTVSLVEATARIVNRAHYTYTHIWVVFDKDDFRDFDDAIQLAEKKGFEVAWSNQSFEYWIYLHFDYCEAALHRDSWVEKLDDLFKTRGIDPIGYRKNNPEVFNIVTKNGGLKTAIRNASRIEEKFKDSLPSKSDPCTKVHRLVLQLRPYLSDLL